MRLDTQSFSFMFLKKQRKSLLHTLDCYGEASLLSSIVSFFFFGNICISTSLVYIIFWSSIPGGKQHQFEEISSSCISTSWSLTSIGAMAAYARDPIQPIDEEQYEGLNRHDNQHRCYWGITRLCLFPPIFLFVSFSSFFFPRYWRQLVEKKNGGLVVASIMVLLTLMVAIDASILPCPRLLLIGHCMLLFPRRCCWYQYVYIYGKVAHPNSV